jgi:hypothetical protein
VPAGVQPGHLAPLPSPELCSTLLWQLTLLQTFHCKLLCLQGVNLAYLVAFICYFGVTFAGYAVFGNAVAENVLESIGQPLSLISLAEACVVLHVAASCQVSLFNCLLCLQLPYCADHPGRGVRGAACGGLLPGELV